MLSRRFPEDNNFLRIVYSQCEEIENRNIRGIRIGKWYAGVPEGYSAINVEVLAGDKAPAVEGFQADSALSLRTKL